MYQKISSAKDLIGSWTVLINYNDKNLNIPIIGRISIDDDLNINHSFIEERNDNQIIEYLEASIIITDEVSIIVKANNYCHGNTEITITNLKRFMDTEMFGNFKNSLGHTGIVEFTSIKNIEVGYAVFPCIQFDIDHLFWDHIDYGLVTKILEDDKLLVCDFCCHNETHTERIYFENVVISKSKLTTDERIFQRLKDIHCENDRKVFNRVQKLLS